MATKVFLLLVLVYAQTPHGCDSVRITRFVVPTTATIGSVINLDCAYNLGSNQLYSVDWYKDNYEFFRCKSNGETSSYYVDNLEVIHDGEKTAMGSCPVRISILNSGSGGKYSCEVSTEGPYFLTTAKSVNMKVRNATAAAAVVADVRSDAGPLVSDDSTEVNDNEDISNSTTSGTSINLTFALLMYFLFSL